MELFGGRKVTRLGSHDIELVRQLIDERDHHMRMAKALSTARIAEKFEVPMGYMETIVTKIKRGDL